MKVGDMVRSKSSYFYGMIVQVSANPGAVRVIWQGIGCEMSWEAFDDLIFGVENELGIYPGTSK